MNLTEAKEQFVHTWGTLGVQWGINRSMAQVHAVLLASPTALSTDQVMEQLQVSRGNANTNLRALIEWGLIYRELVAGDRKDYYAAEKDVWEIARNIARQRRRRELDPLMKALQSLQDVQPGSGESQKETAEFSSMVSAFVDLGAKANTLLDLVLRIDSSSFFKPIIKLFARK